MAVTAPPYAYAVWHLDLTETYAQPAAGDFRFNGDVGIGRFLFSETDDNGNNAEAVFEQIVSGDRLLVQRVFDALNFCVADIGTPTDNGGWWEVPFLEILQQIENAPAVDYVFIFRHAWTPVDPPVDLAVTTYGHLVPDAVRGDLVEAIIVALVAEVKADPVRDADKLIRAANTALDDVESHIDHDPGPYGIPVYPSVAAVNARVMDALVTIGASYLKRVGFAYGVTGYDEVDPLATRARGAALAGLTTGHKKRFGIG